MPPLTTCIYDVWVPISKQCDKEDRCSKEKQLLAWKWRRKKFHLILLKKIKFSSSQIGGGNKKQEGRRSGDQGHEDAKHKPNDEMTPKICNMEKYAMESGYQTKIWKGG